MEKIEFTEIEGATKKIIIEIPEGYRLEGEPKVEAFYPRGDEFLMIPLSRVKKVA
jgi:hypothetical protein